MSANCFSFLRLKPSAIALRMRVPGDATARGVLRQLNFNKEGKFKYLVVFCVPAYCLRG